MSHEEEDMDVMLVKYPGEMPIIDTQKVGRVMSATKERPRHILIYILFSVLAPENTDVMDNIKQLREKLGWKTEIPRHGPGCKDAMEKLTNGTVNEKGCLIHVRGLCEAASGSLTGVGQGDSAISLIKLDRTQTFTLTEFKDIQQKQGAFALEQLNMLRNKIIDIVWESCATVAEMEGITSGIRPEGSKKVKIKVPEPKDAVEVMTSKLKLEQKYGGTKMREKKKDESKRSKPLYAEIAEWRKILNRLAGFLRSVDYLLLEMLRRLVVTAVRHMLDHIISSYSVTEEDEEKVKHSFILKFKVVLIQIWLHFHVHCYTFSCCIFMFKRYKASN
ncbi:hypothetical protein KUTeg_013143 [Tegillarca granosa]|uniref:Uncharacterized protein n=1 Tax=Tegillarca granosa TaxID=220873 RepID=A0ABQ9ESU4_TEGGR|nr:hypothetical protein KUTeg_013143 [Tegillarca granosa]